MLSASGDAGISGSRLETRTSQFVNFRFARLCSSSVAAQRVYPKRDGRRVPKCYDQKPITDECYFLPVQRLRWIDRKRSFFSVKSHFMLFISLRQPEMCKTKRLIYNFAISLSFLIVRKRFLICDCRQVINSMR